MAKRGKPRLFHETFGNFQFNLEFFKRHQMPMATGCIEWTAGKHRQGYGMMGGYRVSDDKRIMTVVHRIAMMIKLGREISREENVSHTCNNPLCVNQDHLVIRSPQERVEHMIKTGSRAYAKTGRYSRDKTKQNRNYKYSIEELLFIRSSSSDAIAERFGISKNRASTMRYGMRKGYGWLKEYEDKNA